jgi:hypothetical protein
VTWSSCSAHVARLPHSPIEPGLAMFRYIKEAFWP